MSLSHRLADPRIQVLFNGIAAAVWFVMVPITLVVPALRNAILYVALMSVWANFATHLGGWISALVNVRAERIDGARTDSVRLEHIEQLEERILSALEAKRG
jgi:hypothetical protein